MWFTSLCLVDTEEAVRFYHVVQWIHDLQLANVDFEVNSKKVADYFNRVGRDITKLGLIIDTNI